MCPVREKYVLKTAHLNYSVEILVNCHNSSGIFIFRLNYALNMAGNLKASDEGEDYKIYIL